jgi:hypothetical protein
VVEGQTVSAALGVDVLGVDVLGVDVLVIDRPVIGTLDQ